jgi:catechol 2,3-dioxygenase
MSEVFESSAIAQPRLHHINLKTIHLQEMIDWYSTVVGMRVHFQFPGGAWLSNDDANHRLALLASPLLSDDADKLAHTGIHHLAFEYPTLDDLLNAYTRLNALAITPHFTVDHGMTTSFYYVDPDGNSVELQCDNFGDWAQSSEWMRNSPQFAANPIGKPVDPDQMIAARQAGLLPDELHRRAYAGEFPPTRVMDLRVPLADL